jgi:exopolyphosphatase/guanosine-5'-triphosphate,3'-diphosphate pyrophosphatase
MRVAVIDLGTNLFNLIIAEKDNTKIKVLHNDKFSVKLGSGGIGNNIIMPDALERAYTALAIHVQAIKFFKVDNVIALGTSALRTSYNSKEFINAVHGKFGIDIELISGEREAELIYLGVRQTLGNRNETYLILDIGGGSNEFILANNKNIIWKESFKLGMARLLEMFHPSDPIAHDEIIQLENYFEQELKPLFQAISNIKIESLIGAEGAFETFYNILNYQGNHDFRPTSYNYSRNIQIEAFYALHQKLIRTNADERCKIKGLEHFRTEMVVTSSIFINYILRKLSIQKMFVSPYSLKEGAAWELLMQESRQ